MLEQLNQLTACGDTMNEGEWCEFHDLYPPEVAAMNETDRARWVEDQKKRTCAPPPAN